RIEPDIWIAFGGRDGSPSALRLIVTRNDAQSASAVLDAPTRIRRRPEAWNEPRIGIDGAGDHREQFRHQPLLPAKIPAHLVRHLVRLRRIIEGPLARG